MKSDRSACPIARSLESLGDRWSILIIRDLILGATKYSDFLKSPEGITTNILANRLKRLEKEEIIYKEPYQNNPIRYEYFLTKKGKGLSSIIRELVNWGLTFIDGTYLPGEIWKDFKQSKNE